MPQQVLAPTPGRPTPQPALRDAAVRTLRARAPHPDHAIAYLSAHSHSFRFAARFFARGEMERVARLYAYCRVTDDLVDRPAPGLPAAELLEAWLELSGRAHAGRGSGIPLLDAVMGESARRGVSLAFAQELVEGMRMDLRGARYRTMPELRCYTYRVAGVIGVWLCRLFGVHDPEVLGKAERMGHAMQLTNILRDVGEDLERGRLYLPAELLDRHGITEAALLRMAAGAPIVPGYRALVREMMAVAEADYAAAMTGLNALPASFARPAAVAAHVYRAIHGEIRSRDFDNLRGRARTGSLVRAAAAARALWGLRRGA